LFDMLTHAPWGGRDAVAVDEVLDVFAGTGALGLEALSRGARHASFIEQDRGALAVLRSNILACGAADRATVLAADALGVTRGPAARGPAASLVLLDPPYGHDLVTRAMARMRAAGRIAPGALVAAETGRDEATLPVTPLGERIHGAARLTIWREP
jgi:16S rRNA (guanine966-N2)-methyltransferase